jgi:hypothetical protein
MMRQIPIATIVATGVLSPVMAVAMERLPYREDFLQRFEAENSGLKEDKKTI